MAYYTPAQRRERTRLLVLRPYRRWTQARKADLCMAIRDGIATEAEALARCKLASRELAGWLAAFDRFGAEALRARPRRIVRETRRMRGATS
jgi:hypothetical protein